MRRGTTILTISCFLISGCSTLLGSAPYGPADYLLGSNNGGYTETELGPNMFRISFTGRQDTEDRVRDLAVLRAADLALSRGYKFFVLTGQSLSRGGAAGGPVSTHTALFFKQPPQDALPYDAAFICDSIGRKHRVRCEVSSPGSGSK